MRRPWIQHRRSRIPTPVAMGGSLGGARRCTVGARSVHGDACESPGPDGVPPPREKSIAAGYALQIVGYRQLLPFANADFARVFTPTCGG